MSLIHRNRAPGLAALAFMLAAPALAQQPGQKTFTSAEAATEALVAAAGSQDEAALCALLGPDGKEMVLSGDPAEDAASRSGFVRKYEEMHRLVAEPDGSTVLYVGVENWPTPIPLLQRDAAWYFDTEAGRQEILFRRIGQNELTALRVCGERVVSARAMGYPRIRAGRVVPFFGYAYRTLGRGNRRASGKPAQTFAFVAYPVAYRSSGVMTFIVNQEGTVYERDLGPGTTRLAMGMKGFHPHPGWEKAEELPKAAPAF